MRVRELSALLIAAALVAGACGGQASTAAATTVTATLTDQAIAVSVPVSAGAVTFKVVNSGTVVHNLVLIKTDTAQDKMPADPKDPSKVQETGSVLATGQIQAGQSKELTRDLAAGKYVIVCNEPAHYLVGMHVGFTVR